MRKLAIILFMLLPVSAFAAEYQAERQYNDMVRSIAAGWNSWDTRSVFTQVYLPNQFAVKLSLVDAWGDRREDLRIGNQNPDAALLHPYDHSYGGFYSDISATWHGIELRMRTAADGPDLTILIEPLEYCNPGSGILIDPCFAWDTAQRWDSIDWGAGSFRFTSYDKAVDIRLNILSSGIEKPGNGYLCRLDSPILISSTGMSIDEARTFFEQRQQEFRAPDIARYGDSFETYHAMQSVLAWDTIFDPIEQRVLTTVSRNWNLQWSSWPEQGGYVIFDWDTYFAAIMLATGSKEFAYANAVEITRCVDECGFVPNYRADHGTYTRDRSQPPVGGMIVWKLYEQYRDRWLLDLLYDRLLTWNRWWTANRMTDGLLCWGSDPYEHVTGRQVEYRAGYLFPAILESGMDNSQMYDGAEYDSETHRINIQDVGLTSLYIADCEYLARMAKVLGRRSDERELKARAKALRRNLSALWDEQDGMFYNRWTQSGQANKRMSPTNFYVLLARAASPRQAERMLSEHLLNPDEFWGEWVIPATPRNDPAFADNSYWRGRLWGPLNYLVYQGLENYDTEKIRCELAEKSERLLLKGWSDNGYVYENWNAVDGRGDDVGNSDRFYHWGALMGYIALQYRGLVSTP